MFQLWDHSIEDADENEIIEEFRRYEEEFLIPPEDALRSVIRKFQAAAGIEVTGSPSSRSSSPEIKKVDRFSELGSEDRNVTVEVAVVSYTPRMQKMKNGERRRSYYYANRRRDRDHHLPTKWQ